MMYEHEGCRWSDESQHRTWRFNCRLMAALFGGLAVACLLRWVGVLS